MLENEIQTEDAHLMETFHKTNPKILILGHGRHGKDAAAKIIRDVYDLKFETSSMAALYDIHTALSAATGIHSFVELYNRRHENRKLWKALISLYNTPVKSSLARKILSTNDMYVGMRCKDEYEHSKILFDYVFWVDRSRVEGDDPTMGIEFNPIEMIKIDNNGTLNELKFNIEVACDSIFKNE